MAKSEFRKSKEFRKGNYSTNWKSLGTELANRDGDKCARCGKSRVELRALGRRLVKAHIYSVRTGNNRKMNLRLLCESSEGGGGCHSKDPKHEHLRKAAVYRDTGYNANPNRPKRGGR